MPLIIFGAILLACAAVMLGFFLTEKKKVYDNHLVSGLAGVKTWRDRLNTVTDAFVALGNDALLRSAASQTNDPALGRLQGQTLTYYKGFKDNFVALSYAYAGIAHAVQTAESQLNAGGVMKAVGAHKAMQLGELPVVVNEIATSRFTSQVSLPRFAPQPPSYSLDYVFSVCEKLVRDLQNNLAAIARAPAEMQRQLAAVDATVKAAEDLHTSISKSGAVYAPYEERKAAIANARAALLAASVNDPLGAVTACGALAKLASALLGELKEAQQLLSTVAGGTQKLASTREWLEKVRTTRVTCPWADSGGDDSCWTLDAPDSNPDGQINQCQILLDQARHDLATGALSGVAAGTKQALAACGQAENMVKAMFTAKTAVDEQVPNVRAELASVRAQLHAIVGGGAGNEMAGLVERTCEAVEARVNEVYALYRKQSFSEALTLLTGNASNEYGLPVAKLLAQSKELLRLLTQAAKVAGTLTGTA